MCFLQTTGVHNPIGISIGSAAFAQLTAESPILYNGRPFPPKLPLPVGRSGPHKIRDSWASCSPQAKRHLDRFCSFCTDDRKVSLYFTMGRPFAPRNCPFPWGSGPPSNTWFSGPTGVLSPNYISSGSAVFAGLTSVTDRPRYSVSNNRPHIRT